MTNPTKPDASGKMYQVVRDQAMANPDVSNAEKVAILEMVKHELLTEMMKDTHALAAVK